MSEKTIKVGSDCAGVGAFIQSLKRLNFNYEEIFASDFDFFARQTYLLNYGTKEDILLSNSKEHKKYSDGVKKIALQNSEHTVEDILFLKEANEFSKNFSFYYPFNMYQREIPNQSIDLYVSSVPCQAFSLSGKREGENDKRGILFYNSHEFIQKNKPRFFIFENVKGLLSHDKKNKDDEYGQTFNKWIQFLGGKSVNGNPILFPYDDSVPYHIYWKVINATDQNIPQNRERVFIVGIRDDEDNNFTWPADLPLTKRLKDVLEEIVDEKYFLSEKMINSLSNSPNKDWNKTFKPHNLEDANSDCITSTYYKMGRTDPYIKLLGNTNPSGNGMNWNVFSEEGISPTLTTNKGEGIKVGTWRTHKDGQGFREIEDGNCPTIPARAREDGSGQPFQQNRIYSTERLMTTLDTGSGQKNILVPSNTKKGFEKAEEEEDSINFSNPNSKTRRGRVGKKVAQTLDTQCNQGIFTQFRIRRLTPRECFRLMDFPEDFVWDVSDSQAYKQAGNSICVGVLAAIISKLKL